MKSERGNYERLIVIFGGMGDLSMGKVLPGLCGLFESGQSMEKTAVILVGRKRVDADEVRERVGKSLEESGIVNAVDAKMLSHVFYCAFDISAREEYAKLDSMVQSLRALEAGKTEMFFFLAVPPALYAPVAEALGELKWNIESPAPKRLLVEKPFGTSLGSARKLNEKLAAVFMETQIYRIDHYLGKEMTRNIMAIRFANKIFENLWNENVIDNIQITVFEEAGIKGRGGYYDGIGAIRDMVQSHMLQLMALISMDKPSCTLDEEISSERLKMMRSLRRFGKADAADNCVIAQYGGGSSGKSYRSEEGVPSASMTETFAAMKVLLDHDKWEGVPFYLRTGKKLNERKAYIVIEFKDTCSYFEEYEDLGGSNLLAILIQPDEGVYLKFNIRQPGDRKVIMPVSMKFCQSCTFAAQGSPGAYQGLIGDAIEGRRERFTTWDEIYAAWAFIDSILDNLDRAQLRYYEAGSKGPAEAENLPARDGRQWWEAEEVD